MEKTSKNHAFSQIISQIKDRGRSKTANPEYSNWSSGTFD